VDTPGFEGRHTVLPRGSLTAREARELFVAGAGPSVPAWLRGCAFEADGAVARDTVCLRGRGELVPEGLAAPDGPREEETAAVHEDEVVWGGQLFNHYGHFLCESVSRLWPILPGGELAGVPVVFASLPGQKGDDEPPFAREWLSAFGVRRVEAPEHGKTRFARMFVPEPAWRLNAWIAAEIREIHLHARAGLELPVLPPREVVWLSRSGLGRHRRAYDEALLEWLLEPHVSIVSPEAMPLAAQVAALEDARTVAGVVGSAFHTLLMTVDPPDCLYLCPPWGKDPYIAQHRLLEGHAEFAAVLGDVAWTRRARERGSLFPLGFRVDVPAALRALAETVLPDLLDDARLAAFAGSERHRSAGGEDELDAAVARVLLEPRSLTARMRLGAAFEDAGLARCAIEQFLFVADLSDDDAEAPLRAARLLTREGDLAEVPALGERALAIDPGLSEAAAYAAAGSRQPAISWIPGA
jgi:Glycosyltransferase 61